MSPSEKTLQKPLSATELAEGERLALERQEKGEKLAVEQYLKEVEGFVHRASKPELLKFITIVLSGSPEAQKEFNQLQVFYNGQFGKLLQEGATRINSEPSPKTSNNEKPKAVETQAQIQKWNIAPYEQSGSINGNEVKVLSTDVYIALQNYKTNPEHIQSIVASDELRAMGARKSQARQELEGQKIHIVNSGNYPHGWDSAVSYHEESYKKEGVKILSDADPKVRELLKSLSTDKGKALVENTQKFLLESGMKGDIRKGLGINEAGKESVWEKTTEAIYEKTGNLVKKLGAMSGSINRDIADIKAQHATMLRAGGNEAMYQQALAWVPARYEQVVKNEIKTYAKDVGNYLIGLDPTPQVVLQKQRFTLPVWGKNVTLDFSNLWSANVQDKKALKTAFETNFDSIYRETIPQKAFDSLKSGAIYVKDHPAEVGVDVGSVVISGIVTALVVDGTGGTGLLAAWATFTATNNAVSSIGYGMIGASRGKEFKKEALAGVGITDSDTTGDILRKKGFELASNTVLFGTFKATAIAEKAFKEAVAGLAGKTLTPELITQISKNPIFKGVDKIGTPVLKTATETTFFTYYIALSGGVDKALQAAVQSWASPQEAMKIVQNEFSKIKDIDTFLDYYAYNLGFIIAVKWGTKIGEAGISKMDKDKLMKSSATMEAERTKLEWKGYSFANRPDGGFFVFDQYGHKADLKSPEFTTFVKSNKEVFDISVRMSPTAQQKADQHIASPDSGRSGGKTATNPTNAEAKFLNLAKNSTEAEKWGVSYALKDPAIYPFVEKVGFGSDGVGVKEGLMKKSGFEDFEIREYKDGKLKGGNEAEKDAIGRMEVASEKIMKEVRDIRNKIYAMDSNTPLAEVLSGYEPQVIYKLEQLFLK